MCGKHLDAKKPQVYIPGVTDKEAPGPKKRIISLKTQRDTKGTRWSPLRCWPSDCRGVEGPRDGQLGVCGVHETETDMKLPTH